MFKYIILFNFLMLLQYSIAIIDDEVELAMIFKQFLQQCGFDCISFTDPTLAFEYFKIAHEKYTLIITDQRMPAMNGIELANKIRKELNNSKIKIFLMTAFDISDLSINKDYESSQIEKIIQKPIKLNVLKGYIDETLKIPQQ